MEESIRWGCHFGGREDIATSLFTIYCGKETSSNYVISIGAATAGLNPLVLCLYWRRRCPFHSKESIKEGLWPFYVFLIYLIYYSVLYTTDLQWTMLFSIVLHFILVFFQKPLSGCSNVHVKEVKPPIYDSMINESSRYVLNKIFL